MSYESLWDGCGRWRWGNADTINILVHPDSHWLLHEECGLRVLQCKTTESIAWKALLVVIQSHLLQKAKKINGASCQSKPFSVKSPHLLGQKCHSGNLFFFPCCNLSLLPFILLLSASASWHAWFSLSMFHKPSALSLSSYMCSNSPVILVDILKFVNIFLNWETQNSE